VLAHLQDVITESQSEKEKVVSGFNLRPLGRTGLMVSPLGIGAGSGIDSEDLHYAFSRGVNYFFYSSDLHQFSYRHSAKALRELCNSGSSVRDKVVLSTVTYINNPDKIMAVLVDQFNELGVDYIDVFHWGWVTERDDMADLLELGRAMQDISPLTQFFREQVLVMEAVNQDLVRRGLVRYVGASFHSRSLAREWMNQLDVVMLRYNLGHLGVERGIFPFLTGNKTLDPGLVAFNVAHEGKRLISNPPQNYPANLYVPTIPDCYRFTLSNPYVDLVLAGLRNRREVDEALAALEKGPLSQEECQYFREYGSAWTLDGRNNTSSPLMKFLRVSA
jgi:aryl-alcohol dehydrogenase-like predicted oxidoreductase